MYIIYLCIINCSRTSALPRNKSNKKSTTNNMPDRKIKNILPWKPDK